MCLLPIGMSGIYTYTFHQYVYKQLQPLISQEMGHIYNGFLSFFLQICDTFYFFQSIVTKTCYISFLVKYQGNLKRLWKC